MPSTDQNATIYRGADAEIDVTIVDSAGAPLDLAGKEIVYRVANTAGGTTKLTIAEPAITVASNVATVPITAAQSLTLKVPAAVDEVEYYQELFLVEGGVVAVVMAGTLTVKAAQAARHGS